MLASRFSLAPETHHRAEPEQLYCQGCALAPVYADLHQSLATLQEENVTLEQLPASMLRSFNLCGIGTGTKVMAVEFCGFFFFGNDENV
jgi:hypothetical protein